LICEVIKSRNIFSLPPFFALYILENRGWIRLQAESVFLYIWIVFNNRIRSEEASIIIFLKDRKETDQNTYLCIAVGIAKAL